MLELKIQCEHCTDGAKFSWFTIAKWRSQVHNVRQLVSICERYFRIRDILGRIPEQSKASGNVIGRVEAATGVGWRSQHSCYAGITGVRLLAGSEVLGSWCKRDGKPEAPTPDVAVLSNRQIASLARMPPDAANKFVDEMGRTELTDRVLDDLLTNQPELGDCTSFAPKLEPTPLGKAGMQSGEAFDDGAALPAVAPKARRIVRDAPKPGKSYATKPAKAPKP